VPSITHNGIPVSSSNSALVVAGEDRDELGPERPGQVPRHRAEEAVAGSGDRARRDGGVPRAQVAERAIERVEQRREVDQAPDVVGVQQQQRRHRSG